MLKRSKTTACFEKEDVLWIKHILSLSGKIGVWENICVFWKRGWVRINMTVDDNMSEGNFIMT